jgi:hypothetical protein
MIDFVEARYAVIVLRQAELCSAEVARDMIVGLARDLDFSSDPAIAHARRAAAVKAINTLARDFDRSKRPSAARWSAAYSAALAWCEAARAHQECTRAR